MIIGLSGLKNSGKDSVAAHLVKRYGYERRAFADPVKKSIAGTFDIPFNHIEKLKNDPHAIVSLTVHETGETHDMTFRVFMQRFATEGHRDLPEMGEDFWVNLTLPVQGYYVNRDIVISDLRFESEERRIKYLKGVTVEVQRAGLVNIDPHRSEQELFELEPDYTIFNKGSLEDLFVSVDIMLQHFNKLEERLKRTLA